ncbi:hypothetical protein [Magnetospira sp. QH-2]|uniref:hypothetical protein n=1 Tax=Magnetospira sp. (strain QH-2) TaxID=1288970 RepID=UPI0003E81B13|nr:hypothetical protein [Magnetospira sp. QH-2]CCQ73218.1 Conserved membrane protein of unknown function [Magnetospira sp. QH-2]
MNFSANDQGIFESFGEMVGNVIAWLSSIGGGIGEAFDDFFSGVARGSGMENAGWGTWALVIIGILLLGMTLRRVLEKEFGGALITGVIGLALIAWAMT